VIGESPGKSGLSAELPENQHGGSPGRLLRLMNVKQVRWVNLLSVETLPWPRNEARESAREVVKEYSNWQGPWLLLGRRVCDAFELDRSVGWLEWSFSAAVPGRILPVPHPSGLNRWWNDPENVERARTVLQAAARGRVVAA